MGGQKSSLIKTGVGSGEGVAVRWSSPLQEAGPVCKSSSQQDELSWMQVASISIQTQDAPHRTSLLAAFDNNCSLSSNVYAFYFFFLPNCIGCISQIISGNNANSCHSFLPLALTDVLSMFIIAHDSGK